MNIAKTTFRVHGLSSLSSADGRSNDVSLPFTPFNPPEPPQDHSAKATRFSSDAAYSQEARDRAIALIRSGKRLLRELIEPMGLGSEGRTRDFLNRMIADGYLRSSMAKNSKTRVAIYTVRGKK